ncbi:hypothetical protein GTY63_46805 [Amycolatopsis rubida]|nr:hypothetical protein [Amycolatopsis rubida]
MSATVVRLGGGEVSVPVRDLAEVQTAAREPVRRFPRYRCSRRRPGLEYLVSTGRMHGFESLAEARLLLMLDFAGGVTDVQLSHGCEQGPHARAGAAAHR